MKNKKIRKCIDFVLLNAYSTHLNGVYNGKTGLSVSLFEWSRHYNDNRLEDHAFELIQESLVIKNNHMNYEDGLPGIGSAFLYLIQNKFIEDDFDKFFNAKKELIVSFLQRKADLSNNNSIKAGLFLADLYTYYRDTAISKLLKQMIRVGIDTLKKEASEIYLGRYITAFEFRLITLLRLIIRMKDTHNLDEEEKQIINEIITTYLYLYQNKYFPSNIEIWFYLTKLQKNNVLSFSLQQILLLEQNKINSIKNLHPDACYLKEKLMISYMLREEGGEDTQHYADILENSVADFELSEDELENRLFKNIPNDCIWYGFSEGMAKVINYEVYRSSKEQGMNVDRFSKLLLVKNNTMNKKKINLYVVNMSNGNNTNGVDRYISCLLEGLKGQDWINLTWICITQDPKLLLHRHEQKDGYMQHTIPTPQAIDTILSEIYWADKYNEYVYELLAPYFIEQNNLIVHIHTTNLIDLANCIKRHTGAKIITHLHCIPWKYHYNESPHIFNHLFHEFHNKQENTLSGDKYMMNESEKRAYNDADAIITLTDCATDFLTRIIKIERQKISIIPNGMQDDHATPTRRKDKGYTEFIYVGALTESKGLPFILDALEKVRQAGYPVRLNIAGKGRPFWLDKFTVLYPNLEINAIGRVSYATLKQFYAQSDIGLIASLQEQTSYVAIEMAMASLPIVTTAVDGLDEMFTHEVDAMKVPLDFSLSHGLSVNIAYMTQHIIRLIKDKNLYDKISRNIRESYENQFNLDLMIARTLAVYKQITND